MIENLTAKDIMLKEIIVSEPNDLVASANLKMIRANIGALPIVDDKKLVGLITQRDVILAGKESMPLMLRDLMTTDVITVKKNTSIKGISQIMAKTGFQRLPVVDDNILIGLITQSCIIEALANNL